MDAGQPAGETRHRPLRAATAAQGAGRLTEAASGVALLGMGAYIALLGPVLPEMAGRIGVSVGSTGVFFSALFGTAIGASALAGRAVDRHGCRPILCLGLALDALALALLPWAPSLAVLLPIGAMLGAGDSLIVVAAHVLAGRLRAGDEAAALNRLNVYFGVGAVAGPAAGALAGLAGVRVSLLMLVIAGSQAACAWLILRRGIEPPAERHAGDDAPPSVLRSGRLWLLAAALLVYVGLEIGLGAWAFTYAREAAGLGATAAALLSSGFWSALTLGRLLSPLALKRMRPATLLVAAAALSTAGALALALGGDRPPALVAGVLLAGVGFGPIWPVSFALVAATFRHTAGSASGTLATTASVGGVVLPWLQGRLLDASGPSALIGVTLAGCVALTALAALVERTERA